MNYENARSTLVTLVSACLPTDLAVFWDNADALDLSKISDHCLLVEFYWDDAGDMSVEPNPLHLTAGSLYLTVFAKEGTGTVTTLRLMDTLTTGLKARSQGGLTTAVPRPGRRQKRDGWQSQELHVPFKFYSIS